ACIQPVGRPFQSCFNCENTKRCTLSTDPSSALGALRLFARKYDFKRHEKSHDTIVYRCWGCHRRFTRRDALRRHKANVKSSEACAQGA
ncbi:hypothetical protein M407DRAFT_218912, partial [Tulasnella calospora MUT 4182]